MSAKDTTLMFKRGGSPVINHSASSRSTQDGS